MTKTLRMNFLDENNKTNSITLSAAKDNLSEQEVRDAMNTIIQASIFKKKGVDLYVKIKSASYVERDVTTIFDDSKTAGAVQA